MTKEPSKVPELVNAMIGHRLITKQTPKEGIPVSKVTFDMLGLLIFSLSLNPNLKGVSFMKKWPTPVFRATYCRSF